MAYARQFLHNFEIPIFFICDFIDVDECKGNPSCHENANCTNTNGSHVCDWQPGYTGNGQNCTGEFRIARKCGHGLIFQFVLSLFVYITCFVCMLQIVRCCTKVRKFKKQWFDLQVQPENRMKPKNCKRVFQFFHRHVHV